MVRLQKCLKTISHQVLNTMSTPKLTVDEMMAIMRMYDLERLERGGVHCERTLDLKGAAYSEASYVWKSLKELEYDPYYVYQFENPPEPDIGGHDLYGQAVDRVAAFLKYDQPIIGGDLE